MLFFSRFCCQCCAVRRLSKTSAITGFILFGLFYLLLSQTPPHPSPSATMRQEKQYDNYVYEDDSKYVSDYDEDLTTEEPFIVHSLGNDTRYTTCRRCFTRDYKMVHLPKGVCDVLPGQNQNDLQLILFVLTKPSDLVVRDRLRQTWLSYTKNNTNPHTRYVFVLGRARSQDTQLQIDQEQLTHNDIVQQDFKEAYNNLTLKTMLGVEWTTSYCSRAQFIQKVDDDVFVNIPRVLKLLPRLKSNVGLFGRCFYGKTPSRGGTWKWRMPVQAYEGTRYPAYCNGPSYILRMSAAQEIIRISPNIPFFRIEDVYIGLCLRAVKEYKVQNFYHWMRRINLSAYTNLTMINCDEMDSLFTTHHTYPKAVSRMWNKCFT